MSYTPQTWNNGSGGGTPVSAARLGVMETGIQGAHTTADTAALQLSYGFDNIRARGAVPGDTGTNASANASAINAASTAMSASGGTVYLPRGVYQVNSTLTLYSNVTYLGDPGTVVKLANGANVDLLKTQSFDTLFSGTTTAGPSRFRLHNLIFDGNKANNTSGFVAKMYASNYSVHNCHFRNGAEAGVWSRWGTGGTNMEAQWSDCKVYNNNAVQLNWQGPHDSQFTNLIVFMDTNGGDTAPAGAGRHGIKVSAPAGGEQLTNVHVWGYHEHGIWAEATIRAANIVSEGAKVNLLVDADWCDISGATVFGTANGGYWATNGTGNETGIQIGTSGGTLRTTNRIRGHLTNWASGDMPMNFLADDGSDIDVTLRAGGATAAYAGSPWLGGWGGANLRILCTDNPGLSYYNTPMRVTGVPSNTVGANGQLAWRTDGGAGSTLYLKVAGAWVARA